MSGRSAKCQKALARLGVQDCCQALITNGEIGGKATAVVRPLGGNEDDDLHIEGLGCPRGKHKDDDGFRTTGMEG